MTKAKALREFGSQTKKYHELAEIIRNAVHGLRAEGMSDVELQASITTEIIDMKLNVGDLQLLVGILAIYAVKDLTSFAA